MISKNAFRVIVLAALTTAILGAALNLWAGISAPPEHRAFWAEMENAPLQAEDLAVLAVAALGVVLALLAAVGLCMFWRPARALAVVATILLLVSEVFVHPLMQISISHAFGDASAIFWGWRWHFLSARRSASPSQGDTAMPDKPIQAMGRHLAHDGRVLVRIVAALAVVLAGTPAWAQVYKWVDERGVTHYSDQAPPKQEAVKNLDIVADRLSVYTPDPSLMRPSEHQGGDPVLSDRIDRLERQLQAERQARQYAAAAEAQAYMTAYEQCLADRRVDCDGYGGYYPYAAPVVVAAFRHRRFRPVAFPHVTGLTAGNVVRFPGIMPGNFNDSSAITVGTIVPFRSSMTYPRARGFAPRS